MTTIELVPITDPDEAWQALEVLATVLRRGAESFTRKLGWHGGGVLWKETVRSAT